MQKTGADEYIFKDREKDNQKDNQKRKRNKKFFPNIKLKGTTDREVNRWKIKKWMIFKQMKI